MFFGLTNSPATFQTMMNTIFTKEMAEGWLMVYMDDMAIHTSKHPEEEDQKHLHRHCQLVNQVLTKLQEHNLFLKLEKCTFKQPSIDFLRILL